MSDYASAIKLIGLPVERFPRPVRKDGWPTPVYIVRDVTEERDGSYNVLLSAGQIVPLEDFGGLYALAQPAQKEETHG